MHWLVHFLTHLCLPQHIKLTQTQGSQTQQLVCVAWLRWSDQTRKHRKNVFSWENKFFLCLSHPNTLLLALSRFVSVQVLPHLCPLSFFAFCFLSISIPLSSKSLFLCKIIFYNVFKIQIFSRLFSSPSPSLIFSCHYKYLLICIKSRKHSTTKKLSWLNEKQRTLKGGPWDTTFTNSVTHTHMLFAQSRKK